MKIKLNNGTEFEARKAYNCPAYYYIALIGVEPAAKRVFEGIRGEINPMEDGTFAGYIYPSEVKEIIMTAKEFAPFAP